MLFDIRHSNYSNETYVYKFLSNIVDIFKLVFFVCRHLICRIYNLYVVWGNIYINHFNEFWKNK